MSITLRVLIEGVCSLVPDSPFFALPSSGPPVAGKPDQVTVLLPDLRAPDEASWSTMDVPVYRAPHWPILTFDMADFDEASTRAIDLVTKDLGTGAERGVILLDHEHVTLPSSPKQPLFQPDLYIPTNRSYPNVAMGGHELTSMWWVPQMLQLSAQHGMVEKANDPDANGFRFGVGNQLVAALTFDQGRLYVRDFNRITSGGQINAWDFGTTANPIPVTRRAIGNQVALEVGGFDSPLELRLILKEQGPGTVEEMLVLRPPPDSRKQVIEVRVGNVEPEALTVAGTAFMHALVGGDPDFEPFYSLAQAHPPLPLPVPLFPAGGIGHTEKPCSGSLSQGFTS